MITIITGPNRLVAGSELSTRVAMFEKDHGNLAIERIDGEEAEYGVIQASVESAPFLSDKKLVILRNPGANKQFNENIEQFLGMVLPTTDLIIVETSVDKRSHYYKTIKQQPGFIECVEISSRDLPDWVTKRVTEQDGRISIADARYLVDRVGQNLQMLGQELDKLITYDAHITRETIDLLTEATPQSTVFQLIEAVFAGNPARAIKLYDEQRQQKVEPFAIIGMLAWQLHVLSIVKAAGNRSGAQIASEAKLSPYVVQKSEAIAKRLSGKEIKQLVRRVVLLDRDLKSTSLDPDDALKQLFIEVASLHKK